MDDRDIFELLAELKNKLEQEEQKASDFKAETIRLKKELGLLVDDKEKALKEASEAKKDAELAKDFKGTHYESLIKDLFEIPSEKSRKQALYIFAGSIFMSLLITYLSSAYFDLQNSKEMEKRFGFLNESIAQLTRESTSLSLNTSEINKKLTETHNSLTDSKDQIVKMTDSLTNEFNIATKQISSVSEKTSNLEKALFNVNQKIDESNKVILSGEDKKKKIREQVKWLTNYFRTNNTVVGNLDDFSTDINSLAIIYFHIIPNYEKSDMYYESYIESFKLLDSNSDVLPKDEFEFFGMDIWNLKNLLSAYLITKKKHADNWRFRTADRSFSTYSENKPKYDLGGWGYLNVDNYYSLSNLFESDFKAVISQLRQNEKLEIIQIPRKIYYRSYGEKEKDIQVLELFGADIPDKIESKIEIDISNYSFSFKEDVVAKVQRALWRKDLLEYKDIDGKLGHKTASAIKQYNSKNSLPSNGLITLSLLDSLDIKAAFSDIKFEN